MAGPRSQLTDQWRPEELERDNPTSAVKQDTSSAQGVKVKPSVPPPVRSRARSISRNRSREPVRGRRRSPSPSFQQRDNDLYRPSRPTKIAPRNNSRSPPAPNYRRYSPPPGNARKNSRSPSHISRQGRRGERRLSHERPASKPRSKRHPRREGDRAFSPRPEPNRNHRRSPRRHSPDVYIPSKRRRSRSPGPPNFRHGEAARRGRSRSPPLRSRPKRDLSPADLLSGRHPTSQRPRSPIESRRKYSPPRPSRREDDIYYPSSKRLRRSLSPPTKHLHPRRTADSPHRRDQEKEHRRSPARSASSRARKRTKASENEDPDMRPSYPHHGHGRGDPRAGRPPPDHSYSHSPQYIPPTHHMHAQSPYGAGKGVWAAPSPYASHPGWVYSSIPEVFHY